MGVREIFYRPLSWLELLSLGGGSVAFVYLSLSGYVLAGLAMLLVGVLVPVVYARIQRRRLPARTERLGETVLLPWPCERVWDLLAPAEKSPLIDPNIRRGYRVPGTPEGLGEQQALEHLDGWTIIIEVIEYQPGRRAVTRQVSPPPAEQLRTVQAVEPVQGGCRYTNGVEIELQAGQRLNPKYEKEWRDGVRAQIERTERSLAEGLDHPSDATDTARQQPRQWPPPDQPTPAS